MSVAFYWGVARRAADCAFLLLHLHSVLHRTQLFKKYNTTTAIGKESAKSVDIN